MKTWFERIDGNFYLVLEFNHEQAQLLKKHHALISGMTNFDFSKVFKV